jgi:hypothetical protein
VTFGSDNQRSDDHLIAPLEHSQGDLIVI